MEMHGTSPDHRLYDLERELHGLGGQVTEQGKSLLSIVENQRQLEGRMAHFGGEISNLNKNVNTILQKFDRLGEEQKTKWPQIITVGVAMFMFAGTAGFSYLRPIEADMQEVKRELEYVRQSRWTRSDEFNSNALRDREHDALQARISNLEQLLRKQ